MNKRTPLCALLLILTLGSVYAGEGTGMRRFGLFVGSNDGGRERVTLAYASTDARMVKSVMEEVGGISDTDAILLSDPDSAELNKGFERIRAAVEEAKQTNRRVEFVLYYSGHSDEYGILLGGERFSYLDLRSQIQSIPADANIAVLDSCSSGAFTRLKGGSRQEPFLLDESVTTKGHAFITSSAETESAQESDSLGASFFTHFLVSGLRGAADTSSDGKVTLNEAYSYAYDETLARTSTTLAGPQHATHEFSLVGSGDVVLTDLRIASAGVVFAEDLEGRMFVTGTDGRLVAEIRKQAGSELTIALPPGKYRLTLETGTSLREGTVELDRFSMTGVSGSSFSARTPEIARERGNTQHTLEEQDDGRSETIFGPDFDQDVLASRISGDLIHLDYLFSFLPNLDAPEENRVVHDLSLNLVGSSYRVEGIDLGLINFVREDVKGAQIAALAGFIGDDLYGGQISGIMNNSGGRIFGAQVAGVFNIAAGRVYGAQAAGVFNIAGDAVQSAQVGGVFNIAAGPLLGAQVGGVFSTAAGDVNGAQVSGVFNIADGGVSGAQVAGVFNIAESTVRGARVGGVFNITGGDINGVSVSGVFDISEGAVHGVQAAGVFSIAEQEVRGLQLASIFNISERVSGGQIGLVNVGGVVNGTQIGLINISDRMYGLPLGLINISGNGLFNPSVWSDDTGFTYAGMQFGAGPFYTLIYAGTPAAALWTETSLGVGFGLHVPFGRSFVDIDLSTKSYGTGGSFDEALQASADPFLGLARYVYMTGDINTDIAFPLYPSARVQVGFTIFESVSLLAGLSLESLFSNDQAKNSYFHKGNPWVIPISSIDFDLELYPRWYFGIRI